MKPIAVLQHVANDGPSYFTDYLAAHALPWRLFAAYRGDTLPADIRGYSGYAILGGPMSANDDLPHLQRAMVLVRDAIAAEVPVIGHCLGGQLMAKALGAKIGASPSPEIGWSEIDAGADAAQRWFGGTEHFVQFQWHHEAFELPPGARHLAGNAHCPHQTFVVSDKHLAMQFHTEIDLAKIGDWLGAEGAADIARVAEAPGVHGIERIRHDTTVLFAAGRRVTDAIYDAWCQGLGR